MMIRMYLGAQLISDAALLSVNILCRDASGCKLQAMSKAMSRPLGHSCRDTKIAVFHPHGLPLEN